VYLQNSQEAISSQIVSSIHNAASRLLSKNLKIRIYKTIILPVVLYGCETWSSLTLREEHRLRVFENRVLRRIFGQKRDEVTGEWRKSFAQASNSVKQFSYISLHFLGTKFQTFTKQDIKLQCSKC
jgi:hypothetical protein